jgi:16S rRNA G966 N2-methylase RsmD
LQGIEKIVASVFAHQLLKPNGWLILEHPREYDFSQYPNFYEHRKYGKLNFTFLVNFE